MSSYYSCRILEKTTPSLGHPPIHTKRPQRLWLMLSAALLLGLGAFVWLNHVLLDPPTAALLTACVLALVCHPCVLSHRLQLARTQRDQALAQLSATQWQMCVGLQKQDERTAQQVQALQSEIADLHIRKQLLQVQAHHDSLTGLANRLLLADRFHFAVERAKRSNKSFALLMIDLNDFKRINDHHGHAVGDAVLVTMAARLVRTVRASDTVARLGGDEFVLLIEAIDDPQELAQLTQKLLVTLADPIPIDAGVVLSTAASVGLAVYPHDGVEMNDLLHIADLAMYECKSSGLMRLQ